MDEENDELRKVLLSRKKKLIKPNSIESSMLKVDEIGRPQYLYRLQTEPVD
jgi:hypothetical protein